MTRLHALLVLLILPLFALPAHGQFFFKKPRPTPAQRVPELIVILKTESDERKRAQAAEELREYDAKAFTEIVPVLIDVLHNDSKSNVRLEALNSLSRLRPVSQAAGQAIEHASSSDESLRVRLQAKSALLKYHLAGYSSSGKTEPSPLQPTTQEPPLADPPGKAASPVAPAAPPVVPAVPMSPSPAVPMFPSLDLPRPLPLGAVSPGEALPAPIIQIEAPGVPARPF